MSSWWCVLRRLFFFVFEVCHWSVKFGVYTKRGLKMIGFFKATVSGGLYFNLSLAISMDFVLGSSSIVLGYMHKLIIYFNLFLKEILCVEFYKIKYIGFFFFLKIVIYSRIIRFRGLAKTQVYPLCDC